MSELGAYLKAQGFPVDDNPVTGTPGYFPGVRAVMVHHFVGSESPSAAAGQANALKTTTHNYPAPYANLYLDVTGKVWVLSKPAAGQVSPGRANHAGSGVWTNPNLPKDQGNDYSVGIECQNDGYHPITGHQYDALIELCAALCTYFRLPASAVVGHKEYAKVQGKVDPRNNMDVIRADVANAMGGSDVALSQSDIDRIAQATATKVWSHMLQSGWQEDGTYNANKPVKQNTAWFLSSARGAALGAKANTNPAFLTVDEGHADAEAVLTAPPVTATHPEDTDE